MKPSLFDVLDDHRPLSSSKNLSGVAKRPLSAKTSAIIPEVTKQQLEKLQMPTWAKVLYALLYAVAAAVIYTWFQFWRNS